LFIFLSRKKAIKIKAVRAGKLNGKEQVWKTNLIKNFENVVGFKI
jgi:hypothetical protein